MTKLKYSDLELIARQKLDFSGGGCYEVSNTGIFRVDYCYNSSKWKIHLLNLQLYFMSLKIKLQNITNFGGEQK